VKNGGHAGRGRARTVKRNGDESVAGPTERDPGGEEGRKGKG